MASYCLGGSNAALQSRSHLRRRFIRPCREHLQLDNEWKHGAPHSVRAAESLMHLCPPELLLFQLG